MNTVKKLNKSKASEQFSAPSYTLNGELIENNNINAATKVTINNQEYAVDPQGNVKVTLGLMNGILMNDSLLYKLGENDSVLNIGDIVKSIKVNDLTYHPNTTGGIDLGHIGGGGSANDGELDLLLNGTTIGDFTANLSTNESININACTVVTQNGLDASVDADGKVNIGDVVKKVRFLNLWVTPASDGGVTLPSPSTTVYGALRGGAIGTYNLSNASNSYIYLRAYGNFYPSPVQFLTLDSQNGMVNILFNIKSLNITSDYNCTYELEVYIESGYDCKVWPFLCTSGIKAADIYPAVGAFVENTSTSSYHLAFGYTTTAASVRNPTMMDLNAATGQYGEPINIDLQPYVLAEKGYGFYKIEATMTNKAVVHTITRLDKLVKSASINGGAAQLPDNSGNINLNAVTQIIFNGNTYNVDNYGVIDMTNPPAIQITETPFGDYDLGQYRMDTDITLGMFGMGMWFNPTNKTTNSMCYWFKDGGAFNLTVYINSLTNTSQDISYLTDYSLDFYVECTTRLENLLPTNKIYVLGAYLPSQNILGVLLCVADVDGYCVGMTANLIWLDSAYYRSTVNIDGADETSKELKRFKNAGYLTVTDGAKYRVLLVAEKYSQNSSYSQPVSLNITTL